MSVVSLQFARPATPSTDVATTCVACTSPRCIIISKCSFSDLKLGYLFWWCCVQPYPSPDAAEECSQTAPLFKLFAFVCLQQTSPAACCFSTTYALLSLIRVTGCSPSCCQRVLGNSLSCQPPHQYCEHCNTTPSGLNPVHAWIFFKPDEIGLNGFGRHIFIQKNWETLTLHTCASHWHLVTL